MHTSKTIQNCRVSINYTLLFCRLRCFWTSSIKLQLNCGWTKTLTSERYASPPSTPFLTPGSTSFSARLSSLSSSRKSSVCFVKWEQGGSRDRAIFTASMLTSSPPISLTGTPTLWCLMNWRTSEETLSPSFVHRREARLTLEAAHRQTNSLIHSHLQSETQKLLIRPSSRIRLRREQTKPWIFQRCHAAKTQLFRWL